MPRATRRRTRCASTVISLAVIGAGIGFLPNVPAATAAGSKPTVRVVGTLESTVVRAVNARRSARGLRPLRKHTRLRRAARGHARYIARTGTPSHVGARGTKFWHRITAAGYPRNRRAAETIGMAFGCHRSLARAVVRDWMRSPRHRRALMRGTYRRLGVGVARTRSCSRTSFVINVAA